MKIYVVVNHDYSAIDVYAAFTSRYGAETYVNAYPKRDDPYVPNNDGPWIEEDRDDLSIEEYDADPVIRPIYSAVIDSKTGRGGVLHTSAGTKLPEPREPSVKYGGCPRYYAYGWSEDEARQNLIDFIAEKTGCERVEVKV